MTLRQINECLKNDTDPQSRLTGLLYILRSIEQGDIATEDGVICSLIKFEESYGEITNETVDDFMLMGEVLDMEIPNEFILKALSADD